MMLTETGSIASASLPVAALAVLLRLPTGFADDAAQFDQLESCLRAAVAMIETRTGKAILRRSFQLTLYRWSGIDTQPLPVAPVTEVSEVRLVSAAGTAQILDPARYVLRPDASRPALVATRGALPTVSADGATVQIDFTAGYADTWPGVPADLGQAATLLAAELWRLPGSMGDDDLGRAWSRPIARLLEPYRTLSLQRLRA